MKSIRHTASARDKVLHIETEGGIVNITVGLTNAAGQPVTSVEVIPWGEDRGAAPEEAWHLDGYSNTRLISRVLPFELVTEGVGGWVRVDVGDASVYDNEGFGDRTRSLRP